ncbi:MAG TPA: energy transducer TonB [Terriglobia bacterium]|nr:energy transducer TonB [Terriglobia bacterium]
MNPNELNEQDIFKTGTSLSQPQPWFSSLLKQIRQRREDRDAPVARITAKPDPSALDKFVKPKASLLGSIIATARAMLDERGRIIETTATPIEVEDLWSKQRRAPSQMLSIAVHALLIGALVLPTYLIFRTPPMTTTSVTMLHEPVILKLPPKPGKSGGGGGGGRRALTPPSKGQLPRGADKQIVPPMVEAKNLAPLLAVETTVLVPQLANLVPLPNVPFGDPTGVAGPLSAGPGRGGGIGTGEGTGIGPGRGGGVGPGEGGGMGGGAYNVGGGVTEPRLISQVQPEYSDDGRKARIQGTVEVLIIVNADGTVKVESVRKSLGYGLDQKAIDAVRKWKFAAGRKDGKPVATYVSVLINFSLR